MGKLDTYKKNQKHARLIGVLSPIVFWVLLGISILCLIIAIKNSVGNLVEISTLLDGKIYNDTELANNYNLLVNKFGEWQIGGGNGGFAIVFVDIRNAMFSAFSIANGIIAIVFFVSAFILGKWLLPYWGKTIEQQNQDMVNFAILEKEE